MALYLKRGSMLPCYVLVVTSLLPEKYVDLVVIHQRMAVQSVKRFSGSVDTRMNFSGFTPASPRNNNEHRT